MPKVLRYNCIGNLIFIENRPFNLTMNQQVPAAKVVFNDVHIELTDNRVLFEVMLLQEFFKTTGTNKYKNDLMAFDLNFDHHSLKFISTVGGIETKCDLFKTGSSVEMIGYIRPMPESTMDDLKEFVVYGSMTYR